MKVRRRTAAPVIFWVEERRERKGRGENRERARERKGQTKSHILVSSTTGENPSGPGPLSSIHL